MDELSPTGGGEGYGAWGDAVNVGDDGKIADIGLLCHIVNLRWADALRPGISLIRTPHRAQVSQGLGALTCVAFHACQKAGSQYWS